MRQRWLRLTARWLATGLVVALVLQWVDIQALVRELAQIPVSLIVPALLLSVVQVAVSAWRWRFTARRLGLPLDYGVAVREYYLATFLNQVLPGGVLGDVNRAWRHGSAPGARVSALHSVAIERLSGQLVLALVVAVSVFWLAGSGHLSAEYSGTDGLTGGLPWLPGALAAAILLIWLVLIVAGRMRTGPGGYPRRLRRDLYQSLLRRAALPVQLCSSLVVVASYLGVFLLLAVGAGYLGGWTSAMVIAGLSSVLLLSMVVPLTVAGWGIREGAAALIWPMAGLPPEQGVALSVGYGALVFVSSLPGAAMILAGRPGSGSGA